MRNTSIKYINNDICGWLALRTCEATVFDYYNTWIACVYCSFPDSAIKGTSIIEHNGIKFCFVI